MRFKVTKIQKGFRCTSGFSEKSKNGRYVGVWMEVWTTKAVGSDDDSQPPYFNTDAWHVVGPDRVEENDSNGNGSTCARERDALPTQIEGAKHVKGVVVLDTKYASGKLRLSQDYMDGGGWQYVY